MKEHSNYGHRFEGGVTIGNIPILNTYGQDVHWVHSGAQSAGKGSFKRPFVTLAAALAIAVAGDVVLAKAGHAETVSSSTAMDLNVAGVSISGLGVGGRRPTLTLDTATDARINVSAANVSLEGFIISANFADIVTAFLVTAADFTLNRCDIRATATNMNFLHIVDTSTTDNAADGLTVTNCYWYEPDAATLCAFLVDGSQARWNVSNNVMINGNATADEPFMFKIAAGKILTGARCMYNSCQMTGNAGSTAGIFLTTNQTTNTGIMAYNNLRHIDATTEIWQTSNAGFGLFENRAAAVGTAQGYLLPAVDA